MSVRIGGPHESQRTSSHGIVYALGMLCVVFVVAPSAIAIISVDLALWPDVIARLQTGQYFGQFHLAGQPIDIILESAFLLLLALPLLLPSAWILNRIRKGVMRRLHKSESLTP